MRAEAGKHKDARTDDRPDAQRGQLEGAERALQAVAALILAFLEEQAHRFSCEQGVAHATPPLVNLSSSSPPPRSSLPFWLESIVVGARRRALQENSVSQDRWVLDNHQERSQ